VWNTAPVNPSTGLAVGAAAHLLACREHRVGCSGRTEWRSRKRARANARASQAAGKSRELKPTGRVTDRQIDERWELHQGYYPWEGEYAEYKYLRVERNHYS